MDPSERDRSAELPPQVQIRPVRAADAAALCSFKRVVLMETEFLLQGREDWVDDVAAERGLIDAFLQHSRSVLLVAVEQSSAGATIVGMCSVVGGPYVRNAHVGQLGMAVRRSHWRGGIGRGLLQACLRWCGAPGRLRKVTLQVHVDNAPARRLYEDTGFIVEGHLRCEAIINGALVDLLTMGRFVP